MAKKTKGHKMKMPKVTKVSQEQMDDFLAAILASNLSDENAEFTDI
jgi:transposase